MRVLRLIWLWRAGSSSRASIACAPHSVVSRSWRWLTSCESAQLPSAYAADEHVVPTLGRADASRTARRHGAPTPRSVVRSTACGVPCRRPLVCGTRVLARRRWVAERRRRAVARAGRCSCLPTHSLGVRRCGRRRPLRLVACPSALAPLRLAGSTRSGAPGAPRGTRRPLARRGRRRAVEGEVVEIQGVVLRGARLLQALGRVRGGGGDLRVLREELLDHIEHHRPIVGGLEARDALDADEGLVVGGHALGDSREQAVVKERVGLHAKRAGRAVAAIAKAFLELLDEMGGY